MDHRMMLEGVELRFELERQTNRDRMLVEFSLHSRSIPTLTTLDVSGNRISDAGCTAIAAVVI